MASTITEAKGRILTKWDWNNPDLSFPVILWGAPGIGKTELVISLVCERMLKDLDTEYATKFKTVQKGSDEYKELEELYTKRYNILNFDYVSSELLELISPHCLVLRLAERPIEQLQGVIVPSLTKEENFARFVMPENLMKIKDVPWGIIFLDELDKASESKFGAATHILENRIVGDMHLGAGWYVIAAANREEDSYLSNPIPPELRNRCANIEIEHNLNVWLEWASKHNIRRDIMAFHKFNNGSYLAKYDIEEGQGYSFPTPRSWSNVSRVIDRAERAIDQTDEKQVEEFFDKIVRKELLDFVGAQAQLEFFTYRDLYLKFNFKEIIAGTKRIVTEDTATNTQSLISDQCVAAFAMADQLLPEHIGEKKGDKFVQNKKAIGFLVRFIEDLTPEIRTLYLQMIHRTKIMNILLDSNQVDSLMEEIVQYLAAA